MRVSVGVGVGVAVEPGGTVLVGVGVPTVVIVMSSKFAAPLPSSSTRRSTLVVSERVVRVWL